MSEKRWVAFLSNSGAVDDATKVSTAGCTDVDDFINVIKATLSKKLAGVDPDDISLHLSKDGLPMNRRDKVPPQVSGDAWVVKVRTNAKRPLLEGDFSVVKKAKSLPLVKDNAGSDFMYLDRTDSFTKLADCMYNRFLACKSKFRTKENHPISYLADGPGSGKSRFLQELSTSFKSYVAGSNYSDEFKDLINNALFLNVTFNSESTYQRAEVAFEMKKSLCLRILHQFQQEVCTFENFFIAHKDDPLSMSDVFKKLGEFASCVIIGIDEVNQVHSLSEDKLEELFNDVAQLCCTASLKPFFAPVLAGTVVGPMTSVMKKSSYSPINIQLPLLSFESCVAIIIKKDRKYEKLIQHDPKLRQLIHDVGGHCRALEYLYKELEAHTVGSLNYYDNVLNAVCFSLASKYEVGEIRLGRAIAYSFLSKPTHPFGIYQNDPELQFVNLESKGLVKLGQGRVIVPYIFVRCFLLATMTMPSSAFWHEVLIDQDIWWQGWEKFNRNYIAFRLSLFAYLGYTQVSLREFFKGAQMNFPDDITIKVPAISEIKISKFDHRFPTTKFERFSSGDSVLNGTSAPFDSFMYLDIVERNGEAPGIPRNRILLAFQMKYANQDSMTPQIINVTSIKKEFNKIKTSLENVEETKGTKFVCVILGRCEGKFTKELLPENCVVVAKNELAAFYGEPYYRRLNL